MLHTLKTLLLLTFASLTAQVHADLLLEPYLGYHIGEWEQGTSSKDMQGPTYGARVGYQGAGLMLGVDYMSGMWEDEASPKNDVTPSDLGLFIGYNLPAIRFYGVFSPDPLNPALRFKDSGGTTKYTGTTMKAGLGFTALPMVSINLEYIVGTYDEADGQDLNTNLKTKMLGATVSLPLKF